MFDAERFLRDYELPIATAENKHCRPGWTQTHCPFCTGSRDFHLGININGEYGNCYRCGWKSLSTIIQKLLLCNAPSAKLVLRKYLSRNSRLLASSAPTGAVPCTATEVVLPPGTGAMTERHKAYLRKRNYDADYLEQTWGLMGTGPVGEYRHRIVAPITYEGKLVSYQGRDITGKSDLKYMACKLALEVVHHKDVLYGIDHVPSNAVVVVEGITDVWRLGPGAVATFGTSYLPSQVEVLLNHFGVFFVLFDAERAAQESALTLAHQLTATGKIVEKLRLASGDPGGMSQKNADHLMRDLGFGGR